MIRYKWIGKPPICKTCKKPMVEWDFFAREHEHIECMTDRISDRLLKIFTRELSLKT